MGAFFIWCSGAHSEDIDRSERNRFVTMGVLLLLICAMAFSGMMVLTGYALAGVSLDYRIAVSVLWAVIIFTFDRAIATTVNFGGFWRGFLIYLPRILVAVTTAILVSEPITLKVFDKEITKQIGDNAASQEAVIRAGVEKQHSGEQLAVSKALQEANQSITKLTENAAKWRAEAEREEKGQRSSNEKGCGDICKSLRAKAEKADSEALALRLTLPGIQASQANAQAGLTTTVEAETRTEVDKIRRADGLPARHKALTVYLADEPSAAVIRWTISLLLLLLELSIVFFKLSGSAHEAAVRHRLRRIIEMGEVRATELSKMAPDYARRDLAAELELDYQLAKMRRDLLEKRERGRLLQPGRRWRRRERVKTHRTPETPAPEPDTTPMDPSPSPGARKPQSGDLIADRYLLREPVGKGGYGTVYRALDRRKGLVVAVKIAGIQGRDAWWREVRFTGDQERTAKILNAGRVNDAYLYMVLPLYEPGSLYQYCTTGAGRDRQVLWCLQIVDHVLTATASAHRRRFVHGDIKPDNILLDASVGDGDGTGRQMIARVADWGISQKIGEAVDMRRGHWRWTAAEILRSQDGHRVSGEMADLYSIGALFYWLLTRQAPLEREMAANDLPANADGRVRASMTGLRPARVDRIDPQIPSELADLVDDWIQDDPERRGAGDGPPEQAVLQALRQLRALRQDSKGRYERIRIAFDTEPGPQADIPPQPGPAGSSGGGATDWDADATTPGRGSEQRSGDK